jgi:Flp pilus assembly protein TadG
MEFSLILPIFVAVLVAIIEFGMAWRTDQIITQAAREGARASVTPTATDDATRHTINGILATSSLDSTKATVTLATRLASGTADTITVSYPHKFTMLGPVVRIFVHNSAIPGTVTLQSKFVMRNE